MGPLRSSKYSLPLSHLSSPSNSSLSPLRCPLSAAVSSVCTHEKIFPAHCSLSSARLHASSLVHPFSLCFSSNHSGSLLIAFQLLVTLFQFGFLNFRSLFHPPLPFSSISGLSSAIHSLFKKIRSLNPQTTYLQFWIRVFIVFHFQCISHFLHFNVCSLLLFN